jgi:glycosyltransferase involved in cell wall biosynthesis
MHKSINISAVIPTYNRENTIARAIDSVLSQEFPVSEIIVVDDGSKDDTRKIIELYGEKVRYIYQDNAGVAAARNRGVSEAKYEWIAFLDSDDFWLPDYLKRMTDAMHATEEKAALYFTDIKRPADEGGGPYWDLCRFNISGSYEFRQDASEWAMLPRQPMFLQASVIRREKYLEMGGLPKALVTREDTFLFHRLCLLYPACAVAGCGATMSSDGDESVRLTVAVPTATYYECSKLLYKELLPYSNRMSDDHRKSIQKRLVLAYFNSGLFFLKKKQFCLAAADLAGAMRLNPMVSIGLAIKMLRPYCCKRF